jgi:hypothetical protein
MTRYAISSGQVRVQSIPSSDLCPFRPEVRKNQENTLINDTSIVLFLMYLSCHSDGSEARKRNEVDSVLPKNGGIHSLTNSLYSRAMNYT